MHKELRSVLKEKLGRGETAVEAEGKKDPQVLRALLSLTFDEEPEVREKARVSVGLLCARMPPEATAKTVSRLLWLLDPQSGANPRGVAEVLGEIGHHSPEMVETFLPTLLTYLPDDKWKAGVLRAVGRIGEVRPAMVEPAVYVVSRCLEDPNAEAAREARLALERIGTEKALKALAGEG